MENRDEELWRIAKKRAGFKRHLASYIIVNTFLWALWYFTDGHRNMNNIAGFEFPWPIWCTMGWGIGIAFGYYGAYHDNRTDNIMKEYQKLKDQEKK